MTYGFYRIYVTSDDVRLNETYWILLSDNAGLFKHHYSNVFTTYEKELFTTNIPLKYEELVYNE